MEENATGSRLSNDLNDFLLNCCEDSNKSKTSEQIKSPLNTPDLNVFSTSSPLFQTTKFIPTFQFNASNKDPELPSQADYKWSRTNTINPSLIEFFEKKAAKWSSYSMNLVDAHCHFDMLFMKYYMFNYLVLKFIL